MYTYMYQRPLIIHPHPVSIVPSHYAQKTTEMRPLSSFSFPTLSLVWSSVALGPLWVSLCTSPTLSSNSLRGGNFILVQRIVSVSSLVLFQTSVRPSSKFLLSSLAHHTWDQMNSKTPWDTFECSYRTFPLAWWLGSPVRPSNQSNQIVALRFRLRTKTRPAFPNVPWRLMVE